MHTPDAIITYQVKVGAGTVGTIVSRALLTIAGDTRELVAETVMPSVGVSLSAPSYVRTRSPLRYTITVTNETAATALTNVQVAVTWAGGAYLVAPFKSSWVIPTLAPGGVWIKEFALNTFSTATGQIVAAARATHPWIEAASAQAVTTVMR